MGSDVKNSAEYQSLKILHVVPKVDQEASGPSYSVPRLSSFLANLGNDVELLCIATRDIIPDVRVETHPEWPIFKRFEVSTSLVRSLKRKANEVDIIHNHSLWSMINVAAGLIMPGKRAKLVCSPRGTLSPWALSRARAQKMILKPLQWRALKYADLLHATSDAEYHDIRNQGFIAPVAIIPNGIDLPPLASRNDSIKTRKMLFVGRLHPTKCIDRILYAWQHLEQSIPDWELQIVGSGDLAYEQYLKNLVIELELDKVHFMGPLYGSGKNEAYRNADTLILPSHSENFGMVVVEALANECPVIASKGTPWEGLVSNGCGWWVDHDIDSLVDAMRVVMNTPREVLHEMGSRGRMWMEKDYSWESVADRMVAAYEWVLSGGSDPKPDFIKID